jgi:hypothetical protein
MKKYALAIITKPNSTLEVLLGFVTLLNTEYRYALHIVMYSRLFLKNSIHYLL